MSGAVTTAGRAIRRQICGKHNIEYGQAYDPGEAGKQEAFWIGNCRECESDIRREQQAAEELAAEVSEIEAEAERRIAADGEHDKTIQQRAAEALAEELEAVVTQHCAMRRPEWESYFADLRWNEIVAEVEAERKAAIMFELRKKEETK